MSRHEIVKDFRAYIHIEFSICAVTAERNRKMRTYEMEINEDFGRALDMALRKSRARRAFFGLGNREWVNTVDYANIKEGLLTLEDFQLEIIEMMVFEDSCFSDVCSRLCLSIDQLNCEVNKMRRILSNYM